MGGIKYNRMSGWSNASNSEQQLYNDFREHSISSDRGWIHPHKI